MSRLRRRRSDFQYRAWRRIQHQVVPMAEEVVVVASMDDHPVELDPGQAQGISRFPGLFVRAKLDISIGSGIGFSITSSIRYQALRDG
jgi:hypothetical protein